MKRLLVIFLVILVSGCSTGNVVYNQKDGPFLVIKVIDGDTLDLNNNRTVRLSGINTPETGECYYKEAKDELRLLTLNKEIYLERDKTDMDKYGRILRYIYIDNLSVNSYLVENGYARVYDKYKDDTKRYEELKKVEIIAIQNDLGVWSCSDNKEGCLYVGSKNSKVYHDPDCKWAKRIKPENLVCYKSEEEVKDLEKSEC